MGGFIRGNLWSIIVRKRGWAKYRRIFTRELLDTTYWCQIAVFARLLLAPSVSAVALWYKKASANNSTYPSIWTILRRRTHLLRNGQATTTDDYVLRREFFNRNQQRAFRIGRRHRHHASRATRQPLLLSDICTYLLFTLYIVLSKLFTLQ